MPLMDRWKPALSGPEDTELQCAKDMLLAASFVRSLESRDQEINLEVRLISDRLEQLAKPPVRKLDRQSRLSIL